MKVKNLIEMLSQFDPELPVCISEESHIEELVPIDSVRGIVGNYYPVPHVRKKINSSFVLIGRFGDFMKDYEYTILSGEEIL